MAGVHVWSLHMRHFHCANTFGLYIRASILFSGVVNQGWSIISLKYWFSTTKSAEYYHGQVASGRVPIRQCLLSVSRPLLRGCYETAMPSALKLAAIPLLVTVGLELRIVHSSRTLTALMLSRHLH